MSADECTRWHQFGLCECPSRCSSDPWCFPRSGGVGGGGTDLNARNLTWQEKLGRFSLRASYIRHS